MVKNPPPSAGDIRDLDSIPGSGGAANATVFRVLIPVKQFLTFAGFEIEVFG